MADIANLLAQGVQIRPAGMERNALMQAQEFQDRKQRNALLQMQMQDVSQQRQLAIEQARQQAAQQARMEQFRQSIPSPQMQASQQALMGGGGPTVANAQRMQPVDPRMQMLHGAMQAGMGTPMDYIKEAMPRDEFENVAPGTTRVNKRTNQPVFTAPDKAKQDPFTAMLIASGIDPASPQGRAMLMDKLRKDSTHQPGVSVSYGAPQAGQDQQGNPVFFQPSKSGGAPSIVPGVRPSGDGEKALTEGQAKAVTFSARMLSADRTLAELNRKGVNVSVPGANAGYGIGAAVNAMSPADQQRLDQAKRDFINATLRRESGAVIADSEFASADKQYFAQVGDSRQVIEQKARNRRVAIEGVRADVPKGKQSDVDRISTGGAASGSSEANSDPLGIRGK